MDIKQLEYFVAACEDKSISQAAKSMYTTQPNVSKNIRMLEKELGRALLERSGRGVSPTAYGRMVLEHARQILKTANTISTLALPEIQRSLRISTYPSSMLGRLIIDFYKECGEEIRIEHYEASAEEITEQVRQGISELGILYIAEKQLSTFRHILSHKELSFTPLARKRVCLYLGKEHPLYSRDEIDFSELSELKFMRGTHDFFAMEHHLEQVSMGAIDTRNLRNVVYTNSDSMMINLLLHTDVCSLDVELLHEPYRQYDIKAVNIVGCEPFLLYGYVHSPRAELSEQAAWIIEGLKRML